MPPADPVGVCLALEGRLNSADGREALAGALRQASGEGRCASSNSKSPAAASASPQQHTGAGADADDPAATGASEAAPKCLSAQAHQLSGDCLSAFAAAATDHPCPDDQAVQPPVPGEPGSGLCKQDTLAPASMAATGSASSSSSSGGASAAASGQRPLVSAAIERTSTATLDANGGVDHGAGAPHDPSCTCPPYAVRSTCGKRPNMEDTYALCPNICELPMSPMSHEYADKLPHRIAVQFETHRQEFPRDQPAPAAAAAGGAPGVQQEAAASVQPADHGAQGLSQQHSAPQQPPQASEVLQPHPQQQQEATQAAEPSAAAFAGAAQLPGQLTGMPEGESSVSSLSSSDPGLSLEKLHFFGVYDGHGGIEASQHCAQRLHFHLSKAVAEMASMWMMNSAGEEGAGPWNPEVSFLGRHSVHFGRRAGLPGVPFRTVDGVGALHSCMHCTCRQASC